MDLMELSQQELPLTAYFTRASKRPATHNRTKPIEDSQSAKRSSKRRKSNAQHSTASPSLDSSSAGPSKSRLTTLQLPTPATSVRKRLRDGRPQELPGERQLMSTGDSLSSIEQDAIFSNKNRRKDTDLELPNTLATASAHRRNTSEPNDIEFFSKPRLSNDADIGIATPQTSSRGTSKLVHGVDDHSPLARSNRHMPSKPSPCSAVNLYPYYARGKNVLASRDDASARLARQIIRSETLEERPSDGHVMPTIPVASSQSQYLLHPDATPKRKRYSQRPEQVLSSQTQEEGELSLTMFRKVAVTPKRRRYSQRLDHVLSSQTQEEGMLSLTMFRKPAVTVPGHSPVGTSPGKRTTRGNTQTPRLSFGERRSQHVYAVASTPVRSSPAATKDVSDDLSFKSPSPSRRKSLTPHHSPSHKTKAPRGSARRYSIKNGPSAYMEDSLTESESDSSALQVSRHPPIPRDACGPILRGNLASAEDDSATEAESDTEILRCVAAIGKQQLPERQSEVSIEDTASPPVVSPVVSPTRCRIATTPSTTRYRLPPMREGRTLGDPGSCASRPSTLEQPQMESESLPSVVREFISMFPGDESYPADFPESLRI